MKEIKKDIIVVGAGVAGICAAVAAARHGATVALVHNRPVLGGNASSEIGVGINGGASYNASVYAREGGIVNELLANILNKSHSYDSPALKDMAFFDFVYAEENIELFLNTNVTEVETEGDVIKSVTAVQLGSENEYKFTAPIFIDCSGDGFVGYKAGAEFMMGREGKDVFGESLAPEKSDSFLQGSTLFWHSKKMDFPVKYTRPDFAYDIDKMPFRDNMGRYDLHRVMYGNGLNTLWWIEYGGQCDTIHDNEDITLELRRIVYGFWDYVKNSGKFGDVENYMLETVAPVVGKRESRRFVGDYILTESDIYDKPEFPDAVTTGGWVIDCHAPYGIYDNDKATNWTAHRGLYSIPYRCLYSKNIKNLFLGGRIISTSHIAHGSTRVIATGAAAAEVSGTAAYLCAKGGISPREVDISELKKLLISDDAFILGEKEIYDTEDCKITASSTSPYENTHLSAEMPLLKKYYIALPSTTDGLDSVEVYLHNNSDRDADLCYNVYTGKLVESFLPTILLSEKRVTVPRGFEGYMTLPLEARGLNDKKVYIEFLKNDSISLGVSENELTGCPSFDENDDPTMGIFIDGVGMTLVHDRNLVFKNVLPEQNIFAPENLLNGFTRPYGTPNLWRSEGGEKEWVALDFGEGKEVKELQVIFNDDLTRDNPPLPPKTLIREFSILVDGEKIEVNDNIFRKYSLKIGKKVKSVKILLESNGGHPNFEILGIRLY